MEKTITRVSYVFVLIGLAMLGGGIYWASNVKTFVDRAIAVPGTVIDLESSRSSDSTSYFPVVKYKTRSGQERTFRSSSGSNPPGFAVGETVEVLYDEAHPSDAKIRSFFSLWGGPAIVAGMGTVFLLIGGGIVYVRRRLAAQAEHLRRRGTPVETEFQSVEQNKSFQVNGRYPWRIVTQWKNPATGEIHLFHSENLWFDPTAHVTSKQVIVYMDSRNPKRYYIDVSFLPKLAK
jgi:hypothetical protein